MDKPDLSALEAQIDELIQRCERLSDENQALRDQQDSLVAERASLIEKSEIARTRVEAMIAVGRPGRIEDLDERIRERERPSERRPASELAFEGGGAALR